jgi:hypothetical protein
VLLRVPVLTPNSARGDSPFRGNVATRQKNVAPQRRYSHGGKESLPLLNFRVAAYSVDTIKQQIIWYYFPFIIKCDIIIKNKMDETEQNTKENSQLIKI